MYWLATEKVTLFGIRITAVGCHTALLAKTENLYFTQHDTALRGRDADKCELWATGLWAFQRQ